MIIGFNIDDVVRDITSVVHECFVSSFPNRDCDKEKIDISDLYHTLDFQSTKGKTLDVNSEEDSFQEFETTSMEEYIDFMESNVLRIYGTSKDLYKGLVKEFNDLMDFLTESGHKPILIQKEGGIIKNATMFYLSDRCININEIHFIKNYHEIWNKCDVMVAANPKILRLAKPEGKTLVKVEQRYNTNDIADFSIQNIKELFNINLQ